MTADVKRELLAGLTAIGVHIFPVHWVRADGSCSCGDPQCKRDNDRSACGKHPYIGRSWYEKATTDMRRVDNWIASYPEANWGALTGVRSGIFVVDIDPKNGGDKSWEALLKKHGKVPETLTVRTGSGGLHLYFKMPQDHHVPTMRLADGIDIKGEGNSLVVIPPSVHRSGNNYTWEIGPGEGRAVVGAPTWLLAALKRLERKFTKDIKDLSAQAVAGERDEVLFHNAVVMLRQGLSPEAVESALKEFVRNGGVQQVAEDPITPEYVEAKVSAAVAFTQHEDKVGATGVRESMNDEGNARRLLNRLPSRLVHATGPGWFGWNGTVWAPDADEKRVVEMATEALDTQIRDEMVHAKRDVVGMLAGWLQMSLNYGRITSALSMLSTKDGIRVDATELDVDPWLLNFPNGTLDLRTGELREHQKDDAITKQLPFEYNPDARCPTWEQTLEYAFGEDIGTRDYFQRAVGYSLTGVTSEQVVFICWGEAGNNGKSTLINGLHRILGRAYAATASIDVLMNDSVSNFALSTLAQLRGLRFVDMSEASGGMALNEALVKVLTGGDPVSAKYMHRDKFEFIPQFKVWILTNERPTVKGTEEPIWRRLKLIPFDQIIPEEVRRPRHEVDAAIDTEAAGVIAWAVRGCQDWQKNGMREPPRVKAAIAEYRSDQDIIRSFLDEACEYGSDHKTTTQALYPVYQIWSKNNGLRWPMTSAKFVRRLRKTETIHVNEQRSKDGKWTIYGAKLRANALDFSAEDLG